MIRFYQGIIAVLLCIILFMKMCGGKPAPCPEQKETVKTDTAWLEKADSSGWLPMQPKSITYWKHDTLEITNTVVREIPANVDTAAVLKDYFARLYYEDTLHTDYGYIIVKDTVTQNRIVTRKHIDLFKIPSVTTTIQKNPRNQVYAGILAQGSKDNLLSGAGIELLLKTKGDNMYGIGVLQQINGGQLYQAKTLWKISFKKH